MAVLVCFLFFLFSSANAACNDCLKQGKVAYFSKDSALTSGSCGYGPLALGFNGGYLAAGIETIYNSGSKCGACFQIRCKNKTLCSSKGTQVIQTDLNKNNKTDLVLSRRAFTAMANKGKGKDILKLGVVDVEYKRIPCNQYRNKNMAVRVDESSKNPDYLAIKLLYQGGKTEVLIIDVAPVDVGTGNWNSLLRKYGAIWETNTAPHGTLQFRFAVMSGYDVKWYLAENVLPADWKPGMTYDSEIQISDHDATAGCFGCDNDTWK